MTVVNKTSVDLDIFGRRLKPNQNKEYPSDSFIIVSDIGRINVLYLKILQARGSTGGSIECLSEFYGKCSCERVP